VFPGDWDACVPYTDNEAWTEGMNYSVLVPWKPWAYTDSDNTTQVGGYVVKYEVEGQFEYRTVRSAGHMVRFYNVLNKIYPCFEDMPRWTFHFLF
jgi:hypothetical protein